MLKNQIKTLRYLAFTCVSLMALSTVSMATLLPSQDDMVKAASHATSLTASQFLEIGDTAVDKKCAAHVRWALKLNPTDKIPLNRINDIKALSFDVLDGPLPVWLSRFTGLLSLSVENSKLPSLPDWVGDLKKLVILRLSVCQLTDLPTTLTKLSKLEELWLSGNKFAKVPTVIANLQTLEHLGLSKMPNMSEEGLNATLAALPKLETFSLALTSLDSRNGKKITSIDVSKNTSLLEIKLRNQGITKIVGLEKLPYFNGTQQSVTPNFVDAGGCPLDQTWFKGLPPVVQKKFGGF